MIEPIDQDQQARRTLWAHHVFVAEVTEALKQESELLSVYLIQKALREFREEAGLNLERIE